MNMSEQRTCLFLLNVIWIAFCCYSTSGFQGVFNAVTLNFNRMAHQNSMNTIYPFLLDYKLWASNHVTKQTLVCRINIIFLNYKSSHWCKYYLKLYFLIPLPQSVNCLFIPFGRELQYLKNPFLCQTHKCDLSRPIVITLWVLKVTRKHLQLGKIQMNKAFMFEIRLFYLLWKNIRFC